ncbi:DUF1934 domain-containing protein [Proteinivorax tanatarense]|uniref:DUF1934 domain-containing protein n=1 Tax=Proteinivorax tanatarense TaxID=1260629 RepID=A0AAU7VL22_9FIRM
MDSINLIISSSQNNEGERSNIQVDAKGKLYTKSGTDYIVYDEPEGTGLDGTTTTVKVKEGKVTLIRSGMTNMKQIFFPGEKTESIYKTPYGNFLVEVDAQNVEVQKFDNEIKIYLEYNLRVAGESVGHQTLNLTAIKP